MGKEKGEKVQRNSQQQQIFVNRKEEIAKLADALNSVTESESPKTVFISGTSGIGKTWFVNHFLNSQRNSSDIVVMHASGYAEQSSPLFPFVEMIVKFGQEYRDMSKLVVNYISNILRFFPEIGRYIDLIEGMSKTKSEIGANDKFSLTDAYIVYSNYISTINNLSKKKTVILCIDDAQWLDSTSFELLEQITHHANGKFLLLVSYRKEPAMDKEIENLERLERFAHVHVRDSNALFLESFEEKSYPELIDNILQDDDSQIENSDVHKLYVKTKGNPYHLKHILHLYSESSTGKKRDITEILKSKKDDHMLPESISYVLQKRLEKTYRDIEDSEKVLMYASVLGYRFNLDTLSQILDEKQNKTFMVLKKIKEKFFLVDNSQNDKWFEFDHKTTQDTILNSYLPVLKEIHEEIAEFYETSPKKDPFVLSYHYIRSCNWKMAIKHLKDSSKISLDSYFFSDAVTKYEQCLDVINSHDLDFISEADICSIRANYSRALLETGKVEKSMDNLNDIISNEHILYEDKANAYLLLSRCHRLKGVGNTNRDLSIDFAEKSRNMLEEIDSKGGVDDVDGILGKAYSYLATVYDHFGQYDKAEEIFGKALQHYNNNPLEISILHRKSGMVLQPRRAIESMKIALNEFEKNHMTVEKARCLNNMGAESFFIGDFSNSSNYLGQSMELFRKLGSPEIDNPVNNMGLSHLQSKDYSKAMQFFNDALCGSSQIYSKIFIKMNLATAYRKQNNPREALDILSKIEPDIFNYSEEVLNDYYGFNRASVHYDLGEYEDAKLWIEKYPVNNYKKDRDLARAKRQSMLSSICEKMNDFDDAERFKKSSTKLFETKRPQKWFYILDYYPCDLHILD